MTPSSQKLYRSSDVFLPIGETRLIRQLVYGKNLKAKDFQKDDLRHLARLLRRGLICKGGQGYSLTNRGAEVASRLSSHD